MKNRIYVLILLLNVTIDIFASCDNYAPFSNEIKIKKIKLTEFVCNSVSNNLGVVTNCLFSIPSKDTLLNIVCKDNQCFVKAFIQKKMVLQETPFGGFDFYIGMSAYSADFNQDKRVDFVIYSYSGGCGINAGSCAVTFILSSEVGYIVTSVNTLFPNKNNFVFLDKKPYFIQTDLLGMNKCNDGKHHNFWVYNLLALNKKNVQVNNSSHSSFPKIIWYTFKPNHKETTIISNKQKRILQKKALNRIFWKQGE